MNWNATIAELELISAIARRARRDLKLADDQRTIIMDIEACHSNGCPLDLAELLDAPLFDFGHDVYGIRQHIDRSTGKLTGCFVPRYAARQPVH